MIVIQEATVHEEEEQVADVSMVQKIENKAIVEE